LITGIRVDNVVQRDGKVVGVEADGDILEAKVVILADGVNSLLAEQLGMAKRVTASNVAVGVKELIELPKSVIEDRFQLQGNEGAAWLFAGAPTDGLMGAVPLYQSNDSFAGVGMRSSSSQRREKSVPQMLEDFKQHPAVAPLISGGKMVEYAAHVVPESGMNMQPELVGDGVLIAGDAAGMCMNLGFTIRGMDLAVAAGKPPRKRYFPRCKVTISAVRGFRLIVSALMTVRCGICVCISVYLPSSITRACLPVTRKWRLAWHAICLPSMVPPR
jgi:electron transfer flavoprotein-quinone oxidoreductase